MLDIPPKITIALPIYNEESFIKETIDSLLSQSYKNIEIIILDNCSSDSTSEICQKYVAKNEYIKYICSDKNIGAAKNYQKGLELATGDYFMWAGGHDLWSEDFVDECIKNLEKKQNAVLAFGSTLWIDENSELKEKYSGWIDTQEMDVIARFFCVFWGNMHPILGVIRLRSLQKTVFYRTVGTDLLLLLQLTLQGDFVHATDTTCYRREVSTRSSETYSERMRRYKSEDYNLTGTQSFFNKLPLMKLPFLMINCVCSSNIKFAKKLMILCILLPALPIKYLLGRGKKNS